MQGLELGPRCQARTKYRISVSQPAIFIEECINDFLHGQVGDEVFLGQSVPRHRFKVVHTFSFSSVSFAIIDDATGRAAGFPHPFRAGLATPPVRHTSLFPSCPPERRTHLCAIYLLYLASVQGLLGLNVAVVLASLMVPRIHQFPVWLSSSESGETEVQLTLLGVVLFLRTVPVLLLMQRGWGCHLHGPLLLVCLWWLLNLQVIQGPLAQYIITGVLLVMLQPKQATASRYFQGPASAPPSFSSWPSSHSLQKQFIQ